jgi:hypothetical protein
MNNVKTCVQSNENILVEFNEMWSQLQRDKLELEQTKNKVVMESKLAGLMGSGLMESKTKKQGLSKKKNK